MDELRRWFSDRQIVEVSFYALTMNVGALRHRGANCTARTGSRPRDRRCPRATALALAMAMLMEENTWGWSRHRSRALARSAATGAVWLEVELRTPKLRVDLRISVSQRYEQLAAPCSSAECPSSRRRFWCLHGHGAVGRASPRVEFVHDGFGAHSTAAGLSLLPASVGSILLATSMSALTT